MASIVATWPAVALREVLSRDTTYVSELEPRMYPKLSVKWWGKGAVLDTPTDGATVRMSRHQLAKPGQVIVSEIWAKHGSIGIVPIQGEGALVTSHFFLFDVDDARLMPEYMEYLIRGNYLTPLLADISQGTTSYAAIRPQQFLSVEIPLPPLDEQRRIVTRIEALAARIQEASGLRQEAIAATQSAMPAVLHQTFAERLCDTPRVALSKLISPVSRPERVQPDKVYSLLGMHWYATGLYVKDIKPGSLIQAATLYGVEPGDFVYNRLFAWKGSFGIATSEVAGCHVSNEFPCFKVDSSRVIPGFLHKYFSQPSIWNAIEAVSTGSTPTSRLRLKEHQLLAMELPLPSISEQRDILNYLDQLQTQADALTHLQAESATQLDALLPSVLDKAFRGEL